MAIKTTEEILESIRTRMGDDVGTDENISFLEDVTDTFNDLNSKANGQQKWEEKYKENDANWRKKYTDRFFSGGNGEDNHNDIDEQEDNKPKTFEELFKTGE